MMFIISKEYNCANFREYMEDEIGVYPGNIIPALEDSRQLLEKCEIQIGTWGILSTTAN